MKCKYFAGTWGCISGQAEDESWWVRIHQEPADLNSYWSGSHVRPAAVTLCFGGWGWGLVSRRRKGNGKQLQHLLHMWAKLDCWATLDCLRFLSYCLPLMCVSFIAALRLQLTCLPLSAASGPSCFWVSSRCPRSGCHPDQWLSVTPGPWMISWRWTQPPRLPSGYGNHPCATCSRKGEKRLVWKGSLR